ncbi:hypothetical protein [Polaribacter sp.]|uniref:hypothetical protein n=1 Tax=Polaribacter sp. TaxID=1920175 RepID=UPI003EF2897A
MKLSEKNDFNRRNFLKNSFLVSGGILAGLHLIPTIGEDVFLEQTSENVHFHEFNARIKITNNKLETVFTPNREIKASTKKTIPLHHVKEAQIDWTTAYENFDVINTTDYENNIFGENKNTSTKNTLIKAAAKKWNVKPTTCRASNGVITNNYGEKISYADLVTQVHYTNNALVFLV